MHILTLSNWALVSIKINKWNVDLYGFHSHGFIWFTTQFDSWVKLTFIVLIDSLSLQPISPSVVLPRSPYWRGDSPPQAELKASQQRSVPAAPTAHSTSPCLCRLHTMTSQSTAHPHPSWSVCVCVCFVLCFYVVVYILSQERKKDKRNVCCGLLVGEKNKPNLEIRTTKTMRVSDWCWFASSQADVENVFLCICYDAVLQFIGK